MNLSRRRILALVSTLLTLLAGYITATVVISGPDHKPITTITLGGPHSTPTSTVEIPNKTAAAVGDAADHEGLVDETPTGVSNAVLEKARRYEDKLAANDQLPIVTPLAAPFQRGCTTRLVQNYSSRRGVAPREFVLHWTGAFTPGWPGVWAIVNLFDRPSFAASSNYVLGALGECAYIVRESDKAWTQAAANPFSISVEVQNPGSGIGPYLQTAGWHQLVVITSDALDRWKIPLQHGRVVGCIPRVPGIVDHVSLGPCGGGHPDISTKYPHAIDQLIAAVKVYRASSKRPSRPVLYQVVAWKHGAVRKIITRTPARSVATFTGHGFIRISVVRQAHA